jgi:copper chaperone CopZ
MHGARPLREHRVNRLLLLLVLVAGIAFAYVAARSPEPTYAAPTPEELAVEQGAPRALTVAPSAGETVRAFDVEGMCCNGCTRKLHEALIAVPGVRDAAVDFHTGIAEAVVPESLDAAELGRALTFDKYTATARR